MTGALDCPAAISIPTIAANYAQMSGVLAGFAFTALVLLLTPTQVDERISHRETQGRDIFLTLFSAFMALIIATLIYSTLAADNTPAARGRGATEELLDVIPLGVAVIMLLHGITLLMQSGNVDRSAVWTARTVTVVVVPTLTFFYITTGAWDTEAARAAAAFGSCPSQQLPSPGFALSVVLPVVLSLTMVPRFRLATLRRWARRFHSAAPTMVLAAAVTVALAVGNISNRSPDFLLSPTALAVFLAGAFVLLALLASILSLGYPDQESSPDLSTNLLTPQNAPKPPDPSA